jgi:HAD superfamily hydrolase (TIGR01549 family)
MTIIYDFDGVMFDSETSVTLMYQDIAERCGKRLTVGQIDYCMSHSMADIISNMFDQGAWDVIKSLDYKKYYDLAIPKLYILTTLEELKRRGIGVSICSNRVSGIAYILDKWGMTHPIDNVVTSKDYQAKPNPQGLLSLIDGESFYVGDTDTDMQTARNADVPFIAYNNTNLSADYHISNHLQILDLTPIKEYGIRNARRFNR